MVIQIQKSISKLGHNIIVVVDRPITDLLSFTNFTDDVQGLMNPNILSKFFSISYDNIDYSKFIVLNDGNLEANIDVTKPKIYLKFKYELTFKVDDSPVRINSITFNYTPKVVVPEVVEVANALALTDTANFDFYALGDAFKGLEQDMNRFVNKQFGIEVKYFRTSPDADTIDPFLNEYSLHNVVDSKCIKVVVPDNYIPEPKHEYDEWGINFESFEVSIDKVYFEQIFGLDQKPRNEDFIEFPKSNRIYYVFSNFLQRGVQEQSTYYILSLKKYEENTSVDKPASVDNYLAEKIQKAEDLFEEQIGKIKEDVSSEMENTSSNITSDLIRSFVDADMNIINQKIYNNGSLLLSSHYDMKYKPSDAVIYKTPFSIPFGGSFGYSSWFYLKDSPVQTDISINIISQTRLDFNYVKLTFDKKMEFAKITDCIVRGSTVYDIVEFDPDGVSCTVRSVDAIVNLDNYGPINRINLLKSESISIDLYDSILLRFRYDDSVFNFTGLGLIKEKWFGLVLNLSNEHKYLGAYINTTKINTLDGGEISTKLEKIYKNEIALTADFVVDSELPMIASSESKISNIRIYKSSVSEELQNLVLSSHDIKNPSLLYLIDNAKSIFNLGKIRGSDVHK